MPIKRRLTPEEQLKKKLPKGWRTTIRHPLLAKMTYGDVPLFEPTPENVVAAITRTRGWKGASWAEKVFTIAFDLVSEKGHGEGVLDVDTYNRLQEHLQNNDDKLRKDDWRLWHLWIWDVFHDHYGIYDLQPGELDLNPYAPRKRIKRRPSALKPASKRVSSPTPSSRKRTKLRKHKK